MGINDPTGRSLYDPNRGILLGHELVGEVIDEVPDALDLARASDGPPRIVVHPNGDVL